jgi:ferredoxin
MAIKVDVSKCDACGSCVEVCPVEAITIVDDHAVIDPDECIECLSCIGLMDSGCLCIPIARHS